MNRRQDSAFPVFAATLRAHLWRAKVRRADLHEERATTKRMTFYDLRSTGITWEVLAGTDPLKIQQRAGHTQFSTTQGYIRAAVELGKTIGEPSLHCPKPTHRERFGSHYWITKGSRLTIRQVFS